MKKANTQKGVNSMPMGTRIVTLHLSCLGADRIISPTWLVGSFQSEKRSDGKTWLPASGIYLPGWLYFHI